MMTNILPLDEILDHFGLTGDQRAASAERARDVTVTAGAGSGKTRTLVARYVGLLSEGIAPRRVAAITFTEKAAREMRTRVRQELRRLSLSAADEDARRFWNEIEAQMDSARIGTIHSLCAEILRAHPAEAGLDPQFGVIEESEGVQLRAGAVESALLWAAGQPEMRPLFECCSVGYLERLAGLLLASRLEVSPGAFDPSAGAGLLTQQLRRFFQQEQVQSILAEFRAMQQNGSLAADAGDKLADQITGLLGCIDEALQALAEDAPIRCAAALCCARQQYMKLTTGKKTSACKAALKDLRELYDSQLQPWLGSEAPDEQAEALLPAVMPLLEAVYTRALDAYRSALRERQALDFDDLEAGALALLRQPQVAARWQAEIAAVLVDEFQDTNSRQRELVQRLCGDIPGRLFVVGDARQSIYRFRGADVTVFTGLQREIRQRGGLMLDLDRTFRAHADLLTAAGSLLAAVMGDRPDPERPFFVPYAPLVPQRLAPGGGCHAPYVECVLGAGEDSESGRTAAARALASRLRQMHRAGEIESWADVTLLFRASTGFPYYEAAFEAAGIPFVTVAGSGFYDRPEIRDLINLLRALSDPWDDQALAGFLRSPCIGLSDPALYLLRCQPEGYRPLRQALEGDLSSLPAEDQRCAGRALEVLQEFEPLVDRLPVAELLRRLVARLDVLAVLAAARSRLWRNAGKLLSDARRSGLVRVRAFLEYIDSLRDVGAREGEAISEAEGAVRLMTIHKSKGLEFPVVVLADAARLPMRSDSAAYLLSLPGTDAAGCWAVAPDRFTTSPLLFRCARYLDHQQSDAENGRLLYVAMTRAKEKLLVSGHITVKEDGSWRTHGWLQQLLEAGAADVAACLAEAGRAVTAPLPGGGEWRIWLAPQEDAWDVESPPLPTWPESGAPSLAGPLVTMQPALVEEPAGDEPDWLPVGASPHALVIGRVVHDALRRWRFAGDGALEGCLRRRARQEGVEADEALDEVVRISKLLLARFRRHPLWAEIQSAAERCHAIPVQRKAGTLYIDLLYQSRHGWKLIDFHTSPLRGEAAVQAALALRRENLEEKCRAVAQLNPQVFVCFLDVDHRVVVRLGV